MNATINSKIVLADSTKTRGGVMLEMAILAAEPVRVGDLIEAMPAAKQRTVRNNIWFGVRNGAFKVVAN